MHQEIVDYIVAAQKHGLSEYEIKQNLINVGWDAAAVEESLVFAKASENKTVTEPVKQTTTSFIQNQHTVETPHIIPQASSSTPAIQMMQNPEAQPVKKHTNPLAVVIALVVVLILGGGIYYYYAFASYTPAKVFAKFLSNGVTSEKTFSSDYSVSYTDNSNATSTGQFGFSVSGKLDSDVTDPQNIKQQNDITAAFKYDVFNVSLNFKYLLLGQVIYFDISQIPQLKNFLPCQNIQWVKIDLNELKQQQPDSAQALQNFNLTPQLQTQLHNIWNSADIIQPTTFFAKEKVGDVAVYHIKAQLNNQNFANAVINSIQLIKQNQSSSTAGSLTDNDKQLIKAVINKMQIKELDLWIGQRDFQLYQFHMLMSVPSVKDLSNPALLQSAPGLGGAQSKGRDANRLADIRQLSSALELYYNDHGGYPAGSQGFAQNLTPTYIGFYPTAPQPADGACTDYYNAYWYSASGKPTTVKGVTVYPSYTLTFCLGQTTGGYQAGIAQLTPQGIEPNIACPTTASQCVNPNAQSGDNQALIDLVNNMTFGGQLKLDATYTNIGKSQNITAPSSSTDILDLIKGVTNPSLQNQSTTTLN